MGKVSLLFYVILNFATGTLNITDIIYPNEIVFCCIRFPQMISPLDLYLNRYAGKRNI